METLSAAGDDPDELFDRVDAADRVIGQVRRAEAHRDPALIHRSVQILVFARDGRVLLQRRSAAKDLFPGCYCASASGHVASGEDYTATARRELREELGIAPALAYLGKETVLSVEETEITALFAARSDGPFTFHPTETAGGVFFTLDDLRAPRLRDTLVLTPAARVALAALDQLDHASILSGLLAML
ncbi:MAG TPA: NUDIX domain-containing protein [Ktedonobacterales bacterium]|nr:NUDIX domain-containing protein [Ktedonobacterales bacterium]